MDLPEGSRRFLFQSIEKTKTWQNLAQKGLQQVERHNKDQAKRKFHTVFGVYALLALPTKAKDIGFRFIIEYSSSLRDFGP